MAGEFVPVVMVPRYTSYVGGGQAGVSGSQYMTIGMDVSAYQSATLSVWRSKLLGSTPTLKFFFEESSDQVTWSTCANTSSSGEQPASAETEYQYSPTFKKRWFRVRIELATASPYPADAAATCWVAGFFEQREA